MCFALRGGAWVKLLKALRWSPAAMRAGRWSQAATSGKRAAGDSCLILAGTPSTTEPQPARARARRGEKQFTYVACLMMLGLPMGYVATAGSSVASQPASILP